jgi:hypothetical protein
MREIAVLEAKGHNGQVIFDGTTITITRKGALGRLGAGKGSIALPVGQVTSVRFKDAGPVMNGYIQFSVAGRTERRSNFGSQTNDAAHDPNSVIFTRKQREQFAGLRDAVQAAIAGGANGRQDAPSDAIDQIRRLGELRDSGIISDSEFETKKATLLGQI